MASFLNICGIALAFFSVNFVIGEEISPNYGINKLNRSSFPSDFIFGAATSSYQIEGAWNVDGKGQSVWDHYIHKYPGKIHGHDNGDVACNSYYLYKEDVEMLKDMNADAYRFSISWPRVIPSGKIKDGVNEKGIEYYSKLIDELIANGLQPFVTISHWDIPQALEEEYGGLLSTSITKDFRDFANLCFERFGDRVKYWSSLNEPYTVSVFGYVYGVFAPFRCSDAKVCTGGNSSTEPYIVAHNMLLMHAEAATLYRSKYQETQKGKLGIVLVGSSYIPLDESSDDDRGAADRMIDFTFGWFMEPLAKGRYPKTMQRLVGDRLPKFSKDQSKKLKGSLDFLGFNYYTGYYVSNLEQSPPNISYATDLQASTHVDRNGTLIGERTASSWLYVYPKGIYEMLNLIKRKYKDPIIYITENGYPDQKNDSLPLKKALQDCKRVEYHHDHLSYIQKAINAGVKVRGYFPWALMDNFEWASGFNIRFGINFVDYKNNARRYPKLSALWFKNFLKK